ncbi:MAG: hypothetical protein AVDCRST_MAG01-01-4396, partial [uncultured Rubrobacteraceae bacterium]
GRRKGARLGEVPQAAGALPQARRLRVGRAGHRERHRWGGDALLRGQPQAGAHREPRPRQARGHLRGDGLPAGALVRGGRRGRPRPGRGRAGRPEGRDREVDTRGGPWAPPEGQADAAGHSAPDLPRGFPESDAGEGRRLL